MRLVFAIQHHVSCRRCHSEVPVNGVVERVVCPNCRKQTELDAKYWTVRFDDTSDFRPWSPRAGETEASALREVHGLGSYVRYGVEDPVCGHGACRAAIAVPEREPFAPVTCTSCGATVAMRAPTELARAIDPHVVALVGERASDGDADVHVMYVVCDYDDDAYRTYRWHVDRERLADAALALPPALHAILARDTRSDVRAVVAANQAAAPAVLATCAADSNTTVRAAAAGNPHTPVDALVELARGESTDTVLAALVSHHVLSPLVVDALVRSSHSNARRLALRRPELTKAALDLLAADGDDEIKRAARARGGGGGWFKRLFS